MTLRKNALFALAALGIAALLAAPIAQAGSCGSAKTASADKDCSSSCTKVEKASATSPDCTAVKKASATSSGCTGVQKASTCPATCTEIQKASACSSGGTQIQKVWTCPVTGAQMTKDCSATCTKTAGANIQKASACPSSCTKVEKASADFCELDASTCSAKIRDYYKAHGWFGVEMDLAACDAGPTVTRVHAGSPASEAGLQAGDVITSINGISAAPQYRTQLDDFMKAEFKPGKKIRFTAKRGNDIIPMRAELVRIPSDALDQMVAFHLNNSHEGQSDAATAENVQ